MCGVLKLWLYFVGVCFRALAVRESSCVSGDIHMKETISLFFHLAGPHVQVASVTEFSGVSEFLARQEAARRRKEEKEKALDFRPDNWKPKKTKPEAPKLGREGLEQRRSESVSLYRTSSPPVASMISQMVRSMGTYVCTDRQSFHRVMVCP